MKRMQASKSVISILLTISLLFGCFPNSGGTATAEGGAKSAAVTAATDSPKNLEPLPTPPPSPEAVLEPEPTEAPVMADPAEEVASPETAQSSRASLDSSLTNKAAIEPSSEEPARQSNLLDDPQLQVLALSYIAAFGSGADASKTPYLSVEQLKELSSLGATSIDMYAIAFLQDVLAMQPSDLWKAKQDNPSLSWTELAEQLQPKLPPDEEHAGVTDEVYAPNSSTEEGFSARSQRTLSVTDSVYRETNSTSLLSTLSVTALSTNVDGVINYEGMKAINETYKEQCSDHYGTSETVDPASGSLTWKDTQISLPGRDGLDLNIGIMYNSNLSTTQTASSYYRANVPEYNNVYDVWNNLGAGWAFRFPSVSSGIGIFYNDGEGGSYDGEPTGNSSGFYREFKLKDYPKGDLKMYVRFDDENEPQDFYVQDASGRTEYFDLFGRLTKIVDRFGNTITLTYKRITFTSLNYGNVERRILLDTIMDSVGRKITFSYEGINADYPEGSTVKVTVQENADTTEASQTVTYTKGYHHTLQRIERSGQTTTFGYSPRSAVYNYHWKTVDFYPMMPYGSLNYDLLSQVTYNHTSETVYTYEKAVHNLTETGLIENYRITERWDGLKKSNGTSSKVNWTRYSYAGDYSGYPATGDAENLPQGYHFSSAATLLDVNGGEQRRTTTTYNHQRQTESVETKILSGSGAGERQMTLYAGFHPTYKYTPTVIEQREYGGDGDGNPNVLFTDVSYDAMGYVISETQPLTPAQRNDGNLKTKYTTTYQYEPSFHFLSSKSWYPNEAGGPVTESYSYTGQGRPQSATNANGETTAYAYEHAPDGKLYQVTEEKTAGGQRVSRIATTYGAETQYAYPTKVRQWFNLDTGEQQIVQKTMDYERGTGRLIRETDGNNQSVSYEYDSSGRLTKETHPVITNADGERYSQVTEYGYYDNMTSGNFDAVNAGTYALKVDAIQTVTGLSSGSTKKTYANTIYNGLGLALLHEQWDSSVGRWTFTQYHYNEFGQAIYRMDWGGNVTEAGYDGWGRQNRETDAYGNVSTSDYDLKQRKATSYRTAADTGEKLNYAEAFYDSRGQVIAHKTYKDWPSQNEPITESYRYDITGNVTGYTDPMNHQNDAGVTTAYSYDALNRLTAVQDALNQTTRYRYDGNGQLSKVTVQAKGGGEQTLSTKSYNEIGLPTVKQDGASQSERFTYNALGQLSGKTDRNGSVFGYSYDESGGLKSSTVSGTINGAAQTQRTEFVFGDTRPQYQTTRVVVDGVLKARNERNLDSLNQIRHNYHAAYSSTSAGSHRAYMLNQRDALGRITQVNDNYLNFYTNYGYNKQRLEKVQTNGSAAVSGSAATNVQYRYYANDLIQSITYPTLSDGSTLKTDYTYNKALGWAETVRNTKGGSVVLSSYSYSYDHNGNITAVSESRNNGAAQTTAYGYDALNRLVSITRPDGGSTSYTYDVRGNRLTLSDTASTTLDAEDTRYTYDLLNTLTSVTKGNSTTSFEYYADGLRYLKSTGNTHTQVNYDFNGQVITEEKLSGGTIVEQANFVRGDRVLVKKDKKAGKSYYYLYNGHGDVVQMVDVHGNVVNSYAYDVWGNITSQTEGTSNSFKYAGETYDAETGLYYLRARYYDPSIGRFLNEDTVEGQIDNPLTLNLYTYVSNNPLKYIDPTGNRQCINAYSCDVKNTRTPGFWEAEWSAVKAAHSSWFSAIDFWTAGLLSETKEYARISQEEPWSVRHFASAALLMMNFWPGGKFEKESADLTATIWRRITATQSVRRGTNIPTSFVLEDISANGHKIWVHGNATKHMEEYMKSENISMLSNDARRMIEQSMLASFESAVKGLTIKNGRHMYNINGWELGINITDKESVIYHAVYKGK